MINTYSFAVKKQVGNIYKNGFAYVCIATKKQRAKCENSSNC